MMTPTLTVTRKLSNAAQAVYDRNMRPFADGVIAGTCTPSEFMAAQASAIAWLEDEFADRCWA